MRACLILPMIVLFLPACGGGSSPPGAPPADLAAFTGAAWTGMQTFTITCEGMAQTFTSNSYSIAFVAQEGGITTASGCSLDFSVAGETASLLYEKTLYMDSAHPTEGTAECVAENGGVADGFLYQGARFVTDGGSLTGTDYGTIVQVSGDGGITDCTFTDSYAAMR